MSRVLVVNAGSTSVKLSTVDTSGASEPLGSVEHAPDDVVAVAHRIVHGGERFRAPVVVDDEVESAFDELRESAPLPSAPAFAALREARRALPGVPHVAVFDTAFHATIQEEAAAYAVPRSWRDEWGIRRYGFHGLSVQWASERVQVARLVVCHLGGGCSVTAVRDGRSVDTTMGFSPLEGVPMATRSGSIDVEIVLHLLRTGRLDVEELEQALESESGLLGLSGTTSRVEELEDSADPDARLALAVFAHAVAAAVAAKTASLGGVDAIVFTAGIGEGSARVRADVCSRLGFLGVELDAGANAAARPDSDVASAQAACRVVVLHAREDVVAATAARTVLSLPAQAPVEPLRLVTRRT
jgi:acetate kinase